MFMYDKLVFILTSLALQPISIESATFYYRRKEFVQETYVPNSSYDARDKTHVAGQPWQDDTDITLAWIMK